MKNIFMLLNNTMLKSIRIRIILVIIVFIFIPALYLLNYSFKYSEKVLQEKVSKLVVDNLQQIGNQIENVCMDIIKLSNVLYSNSTINNALSQVLANADDSANDRDRTLKNEDFIRMSLIDREISYAKANIFFNYNSDVLIFDDNGKIYNLSDNYDSYKLKTEYMKNYREQEWYKKITSEKQNVLWTAPFHYNLEVLGKDISFISATRVIKSDYKRDAALGIIMVNVGEEHFKDILRKQSTGGVIALINEEQKVIFSTDMEKAKKFIGYKNLSNAIPRTGSGFFSETIEKKKYMVNYYSMDRFGWALVCFNSYDEIMKEISTLKTKIYFLNIAIFIIFLVLCLGLILYITNPLNKIINTLRKIKIGDYFVGSKGEYFNDDMNVMVESIEYMIKRIEELIKLVIEKQKLESQLKYEALRAQINPHFLFNTLNIIKWSAMMSGASNVSKMITSLGKLLETSMNKGEDEISLREEFELVEAYIFIQNARYNDKFLLKIDAEKDLLDLKVLKLILQPIVENSVIHGLKNLESEGIIYIKAKKGDGFVKLQITDNGEGIDSERLRQILDNVESQDTRKKYSSIGLKNVNDRIKIKYGSEYGLEITSIVREGTSVSLTLPIIQ